MRGRAWIVATALLGMVACGPPRQSSMHVLDVGTVVSSLAFAPDGRTLACALSDRILLVDAESGTRIRELGPLPEQHLSLAYSRERLLSAGRDGYARAWDVKRGIEIGGFRIGVVGNLAISPDGRWLVTTPAMDGHDGQVEGAATVTVWDLDRDRHSPPIPGSSYAVQALAVSGEGLVAVSCLELTIDIIEAHGGRRVRSLRQDGSSTEWVSSLAFSPENPHLLAAGDNLQGITLWDVADNRSSNRFFPHLNEFGAPSERIAVMAFAPRGILVAGATGGCSGLWRIRERPTYRHAAIRSLSDSGSGGVRALAVNRDGSLIAEAHGDQTIRIWRGPAPR